jgi:FkbM family methyltransferase
MKTQRFPKIIWPQQIARTHLLRYTSNVRVLHRTIEHCKKRGLAVQAGGHCGVWPRYLAARFKRVVTFEPHPELFPVLCQNVENSNVVAHNVALGNSIAPVEFVLQGGTMGGSHVDAAALKKGRKFVMVEQAKLDSFELSPDLIVLDIEGSELDALLGAEDTIRRCRPVLHLELCGHIERYKRGTSDMLRDFLNGYGYQEVSRANKDAIFVCR